MPVAAEEEFRGTSRFSVRRRLGAGAYGVVYEAFDRERGTTVALKTLRAGNVEALYRLKREFRALADITHPNLATLYEMLTDDDVWFFTMELVEGSNFLQYVRAQDASRGPVPAECLAPTVSETPADPGAGTPPEHTLRSFDAVRLRNALRQVVSGVAALHEAGKLHRDIKPSNVLVTREGRVVMLDFGLVTELGPFADDRSLSLAGTPAYMSPEQGSRVTVSEKSDWYSLGVMLYEALTDRLPFSGSLVQMMWDKNHDEPNAPRALQPGVPDDLDALCLDLLSREPSVRPTAEEILLRLGGTTGVGSRATEVSPVSLRPGPFVGRHAQLSALRDALDASRRGQAMSVYVHGTSGIGKSALVRHFLDELRSENVVILSGRCYERESMPYKALDSLVDSLSHYLKRLRVDEAEALLPMDVLALARVFPVLRRVEAVAGTRRKTVEIADSLELRRRAFGALRELLARLARQRDVVLFIDDLQWGDADSAALLDELMRPPDPPALLLITAYRTEEAATSPLLKRLLERPDAGEVRRLAVEELAPSEARELAHALLGMNPSVSPSQAEVIARESAGNPFFIDELVRFGRLGAASTLDEMVRARVLLLPDEARRLLEVVAVAGQPLEAEVADGAAGLGDEPSAVAVLRVGHLVRVRSTGGRQEIEPYHDRIREAVVAQLSAEALREHHRRLAAALESSGRADPEQLALHFREAGDAERAAEFAVLGADRAAHALAFDRAARLYRAALESGLTGDVQARRSLALKLADALANAGRGREAARAYLVAADGASRAETLELERRAAGQLTRAGHMDEALPLFERITGRLGLSLVQPSWRTLLFFLLERAMIRLRGVNFRERDASQVPAEELIRLDTYYTLSSGVSLINTARARELLSRYLLLALKVGEPSRAALALATESAYTATRGWSQIRRVEKLDRTALEVASRVKDPHANGMVHAWACGGALFLGRWKACWERGQIAETIFRERCTGVAWELDLTHVLTLRGLSYLGRLKELALRLPALIREAQERDDLAAVATLRIRLSYLAHLASDEPAKARENLRQIVESLSRKAFTNPHYWAMIAGGEIALFEEDAEGVWNLLLNQWPAFKRSGLIRLQFYRIEALHVRARSGLASAAQSRQPRERKAFLRSAERDARLIEREAAPWALPLAKIARAGIAATRRQLNEAAQLVGSVEQEFLNRDMALYAAAARRRRGELLGGEEGRALVEAADAWMAGQEIKNPARMTAMLAPGSWSEQRSVRP